MHEETYEVNRGNHDLGLDRDQEQDEVMVGEVYDVTDQYSAD